MVDFQFYNPCRILFGKDNESKLPELIRNLGGSRVLMHYGGGSIKKNGVYDKVTQALKDGGIEFYELGGVQPNPRLKLVREGIALCKEKNLDFILAVGGGSVIDSSKAISVGVYQDDVWDCFVNGAVYPTKSIPVGVVLTIPAAAKAPDACVITNDEGQLKRGLTCECIYPKFALLNPEYTYSMPKAQIANGACDIMAHLFERYFTNVEHVELTDRLIESALKTMMLYVPHALKDPTPITTSAQKSSDRYSCAQQPAQHRAHWRLASYNIEHELSGMYDIAHGAGLAIIFPAWMKYCAPKTRPVLRSSHAALWTLTSPAAAKMLPLQWRLRSSKTSTAALACRCVCPKPASVRNIFAKWRKKPSSLARSVTSSSQQTTFYNIYKLAL